MMKAGKEKYAEAADVSEGHGGGRWRMQWVLVGVMAFWMLS